MFNWFKSKVVLKDENIIMSSVDNKKGLKIGSELSVPNNFCCLIYSKNKYYSCLDCGKHKLNSDNLPTLIANQTKNKSKQKKIRFVGHFINMGNLELRLKYKKKVFIVNFCVADAIKFADLMLLYNYKVDNDYTKEYLTQIFHELLLHNMGNNSSINSDCLSKYGITINSFETEVGKSSIFSKSKTKKSIIEDNKSQSDKTEVSIFHKQTDATTIETQVSTQPKSYSCPKCGCVTKFSTTYCLKCGYKYE